jgi:hypothetical protein
MVGAVVQAHLSEVMMARPSGGQPALARTPVPLRRLVAIVLHVCAQWTAVLARRLVTLAIRLDPGGGAAGGVGPVDGVAIGATPDTGRGVAGRRRRYPWRQVRVHRPGSAGRRRPPSVPAAGGWVVREAATSSVRTLPARSGVRTRPAAPSTWASRGAESGLRLVRLDATDDKVHSGRSAGQDQYPRRTREETGAPVRRRETSGAVVPLPARRRPWVAEDAQPPAPPVRIDGVAAAGLADPAWTRPVAPWAVPPMAAAPQWDGIASFWDGPEPFFSGVAAPGRPLSSLVPRWSALRQPLAQPAAITDVAPGEPPVTTMTAPPDGVLPGGAVLGRPNGHPQWMNGQRSDVDAAGVEQIRRSA